MDYERFRFGAVTGCLGVILTALGRTAVFMVMGFGSFRKRPDFFALRAGSRFFTILFFLEILMDLSGLVAAAAVVFSRG